MISYIKEVKLLAPRRCIISCVLVDNLCYGLNVSPRKKACLETLIPNTTALSSRIQRKRLHFAEKGLKAIITGGGTVYALPSPC